MKRGFLATGALTLSLMLAACGGAPTTTGSDSTTGTSSTAATGAGTSATSGTTGTNPTSATSGTTGTNPTSAAGTSATSGTTGTNPTSAAGTSATSGTTGTSATSAAGTNPTSGTTGTNPTSSAGTSATSGTTGTNPTSSAGTSATSGTTGTNPTSSAGTSTQSAIEALIADPQFSTLASLLSSTGLDKQLEAAGPVTIFAPTDEAFAALPEGTLAALSQDPAQLAQILRYHVAEGTFRASDITQEVTVPTLEGENVTVSVSGGTIRVNDTALSIAPEISAGASVIHAIDQVLIPSTVNLPAAVAP